MFYEDNQLLVLYKPAGLVMQRDTRARPNLVDLAKAWLKVRHAKPGRVFAGMVHRLDAPVAGVLLLARTSKAAARLSGQFRAGSVEKTYLAVVQGRPGRPADRLVHQLVRRGRYSRPAEGDLSGGQTAVLSYRLLETRADRSLLEVDLETGRRHQIRAQLAAMGCPIWGDIHYGAGRALPHGCIALLASRLAFIHPTLQTAMRFESPVPEGWLWPVSSEALDRPYWSIEDYQSNGLKLPLNPG
ncbi:MAG: RNA pseudouridine synthase [Desulfatiglandales bacterium]